MATRGASELEKLAEARGKDLFNKAKAIAKELGSLRPYTPITFERRTLKTGELEITYSDIFHWYSETEEENSIVCYKNQLVFAGCKIFRTRPIQSEKEMTADIISAYDPSAGNWTEKIDLLYGQAKKDKDLKHS